MPANTDYSEETWRETHSPNYKKSPGSKIKNTKSDVKSGKSKSAPNSSINATATHKGKGGPTQESVVIKENTHTNLDKVEKLLTAMLSELKSISDANTTSNEYLDDISQKNFVDQELRDSINSLSAKSSHKKSTASRTSGSSSRTIANLARPT